MLVASFARPCGMFDNWFNKLTSFVTGGSFCHSEFVFSFPVARMREFLTFAEEDESEWQRKLVRYEEDGMIHLCFYIVWGDDVSYRLMKKKHNNPFYRYPNESQFCVVGVDATPEEEFEMAKFLMDQRSKNYDYVGALSYFVPLRDRAATYNRWFCSQLMVATLQHVNKLKDVNPSGITPNGLYNILVLNP